MAAAGLVALALLLSGFGLFLLFETALDRRTADELNHTAKFLAGQVGFDPNGELIVDQTPADPRYATPYGGLYWQIETAAGKALRSRSLWDKTLALPNAPAAEMEHHATVDLAAPDGGRLIAVFRTVSIKAAPGSPLVVITVGMDRRQLEASRSVVERLLPASIAALGIILALAMAAFVHRALSPFRALREDLKGVHEGRESALPGGYASEVQPLVDDLNRLLCQQEEALVRARTQAGDVAHGLKTPLAILTALARRIEDDRPDLAAEIDEQSRAMQQQVSRALARARTAAAAGLQRRSTPVLPVVEQLVAALRDLPGSAQVEWRVSVPPSLAYPASDGDLIEMLGNLVDNARKWAQGVIIISGRVEAGRGAIAVEDDGPGMNEAEMAAIARGRRWDEAVPGTGFGLAITQDLAVATGGALRLGPREGVGLRAMIEWTV